MRKTKIMSMMLIASLTVGALTGCGSSLLNNQLNGMEKTSTSENVGGGNSKSSAVASAGYLEQTVKDVFTENVNVLGMSIDKDNNIYIFALDESNKVTRYNCSNGSWSSEEITYLDGFVNDACWICSIVHGQDGNDYAVCEEYTMEGAFVGCFVKNCTTNL